MKKDFKELNHGDILTLVKKTFGKKILFIHPATYLIEHEGINYIYKTFPDKKYFFTGFITNALLKREYKILKRLNSIYGIPKALNYLDNYGYLIEWIDALPLSNFKKKFNGVFKNSENSEYYISGDFFKRGFEILKEIHASGIAHCDIRRKNILADKNDCPHFIDFDTAFYVNKDSNFIKKCLFKIMIKIDLITFLKIKQSYYPDLISSQENEILQSKPILLKIGIFFRQNIYKKLRKLF